MMKTGHGQNGQRGMPMKHWQTDGASPMWQSESPRIDATDRWLLQNQIHLEEMDEDTVLPILPDPEPAPQSKKSRPSWTTSDELESARLVLDDGPGATTKTWVAFTCAVPRWK